MKEFILKLDSNVDLNRDLVEFINNKNLNRDICRPFK
jgi:hypothetical protein